MTEASPMLILPGWMIQVPGAEPRREWGIRIEADRIRAVGPHRELLHEYPEDEVLRAPKEVLSPGFVNAHTHLYGLLAHGIPLAQAPEDFWGFLDDFWWPLVEDRLDHSMISAATDLRCGRMLQSGVTSFYDCTEAPFALPGVLEAQAAVVEDWGLRAVLSFEATERVSQENGQLGLEENAAFIRQRQDPESLVRGLMCFHTTFTCSAEFIRRAVDLGRELGAPIHMHCAEGTHEPEYCLEHFGKRTLHYYDELGILGPDILASQCVQVDGSEIQRMADNGVRMTHMPLSNCEVGGGIAPVPQLIEAGVTVGLGSDGYIDDFFEVMRGAFLIHKAQHRDPRVMPASLVWKLATEGGARALGFEEVGRLEQGYQADLCLIDADFDTPLTGHNLYEQLLLYRNAEHIRLVMVAGRVVLKDGALQKGRAEDLVPAVHEAAQSLWADL